jgi:hypothetical protein
MLHVRYNGTSSDFETDVPKGASQEEVKELAAQLLEIDVFELADYHVATNEDGEFIVRPEAVYG